MIKLETVKKIGDSIVEFNGSIGNGIDVYRKLQDSPEDITFYFVNKKDSNLLKVLYVAADSHQNLGCISGFEFMDKESQ